MSDSQPSESEPLKPTEEDIQWPDYEEDPTKWYVVGYCDSDSNGKKDAEVHGPYFMFEEAEAQGEFMTREFYSKRFFDRIVLVWSCLSEKLYRHEVMEWETTNRTCVLARYVDGEGIQPNPSHT